MFSGWVTMQLLPAQVAYLPSRLSCNMKQNRVVPRFWRDLYKGSPTTVVACVGVACAGLPLFDSVDTDEYLFGALAVVALTVTSPFQDHVRRALHISELHVTASIVSVTTLIVSAVTIGATSLQYSDGYLFLPFAALALGNIAGVIVGVALTRHQTINAYSPARLRTRIAYLGPDFLAQSAGYLVSVLASQILGVSALAALETARVAASPVIVVVTGLATSLVPTAVRSFSRNDPIYKRQLLSISAAAVSLGAVYSLIVYFSGSRLEYLFGRSFDVHLGSSRSFVATVDSAAMGASTVLFTAGQTTRWTLVALIGSLVTLAMVVPCALLFGAYGVVLAQGLGAGVKSITGITFALRARAPRAGTAV
ncbi:O-antigen/teichoic acid export membrane protein [Rhodococcus sp. SORGH_AS303]|nr:O-antigen/teichoic acid export membrane protein [Rhodococcus sp. SORGH_AS_0303]